MEEVRHTDEELHPLNTLARVLLLELFKLELLVWCRLIKFCRFQVCNSKIYHLDIVMCVYHPKWSLLPYHIFDPVYPLLPLIPSSLWQPPYCCLCLRFCLLAFLLLYLLPSVLHATWVKSHGSWLLFSLTSLSIILSTLSKWANFIIPYLSTKEKNKQIWLYPN